MTPTTAALMDSDLACVRLKLLVKHFSKLPDGRDPERIFYPLAEVLLLLTCATIASCDDCNEMVAWGNHHLPFLGTLAAFENGIPCARWLRILVNRLDPAFFAACFAGWIRDLWPERHDLIAIDGKTSRRTHDKRKGIKALHTLSAYATSARLVLAQLSAPEKTNEITAIPDLLDHLSCARPVERHFGNDRRDGLPGRDRRQNCRTQS